MLYKDIYFVLDTNILLHDPKVFAEFSGCKVVIPVVVLEELDGFKAEKGDVGKNARTAIKILEHISSLGDIANGVDFHGKDCALLGGSRVNFHVKVYIELNKLVEKRATRNFALNSVDNTLLDLCLSLQEQGKESTLLTRDINLRVKARSVGVKSQDYDICRVDDYDYKGWKQELTDAMTLKSLNVDNLGKHFDLSGYKTNEFLVVRNKDNENRYKIFRYINDKKGFLELDDNPDFWGFMPRNFCQRMAAELLLDDSIPLVFLMGAAGTGKTLFTLLAGLYKVLIERRYSKFFVTRPLVALGSDIGFTPGDLQEKLFHWMHPIYDNLEHVFNQIELSGEYFNIPNLNPNQKQDHGRRRRQRNNFFEQERAKTSFDHKIHKNIATLQHKGLLNLEAITHMRGRSLAGQFMFIDEAQNLTAQELKTIITRVGKGTKIVIAGDPYQIDSQFLDFYNNGITVSSLKLRDEKLVGQVFLDISERSELAKLASKLL